VTTAPLWILQDLLIAKHVALQPTTTAVAPELPPVAAALQNCFSNDAQGLSPPCGSMPLPSPDLIIVFTFMMDSFPEKSDQRLFYKF
jgi:hypothetical protein